MLLATTSILDYTFLHNPLRSYLHLALIILGTMLFVKYISRILGKLVYRLFKKWTADNELLHFEELLIRPISIFIGLIIIYFAFQLLRYPQEVTIMIFNQIELRDFLHKIWYTLLVLSITWMSMRVIDFIVYLLLQKALFTKTKTDDQVLFFAKDIFKVAIGILSVLFILGAIYKLDIRGLLGAAGIATLAIALAAKETLENLISSIIILIERPYSVGDIVKAGEAEGQVEKIGFRSTILRSPDKTLVTIPNKKMVESLTENQTDRINRNVKQHIYIKPNLKSSIIKEILRELETTLCITIDGVIDYSIYLQDIDKGNLHIYIEYLLPSIDSKLLQQSRQSYNLKIIEMLEKYGAELSSASI